MGKKNQKYRKQKRTKSFPWLFVVLGGGMLILTAILFANRNGGGRTSSITVNQQRIDYGDVKFGVNKSFAIKVTNTGDGTLRFKEAPYIEVLEGC
jgi:hypothetical protein